MASSPSTLRNLDNSKIRKIVDLLTRRLVASSRLVISKKIGKNGGNLLFMGG